MVATFAAPVVNAAEAHTIDAPEAALPDLAALFNERVGITMTAAAASNCGQDGHCNYTDCPATPEGGSCDCVSTGGSCSDDHFWEDDTHPVYDCKCDSPQTQQPPCRVYNPLNDRCIVGGEVVDMALP